VIRLALLVVMACDWDAGGRPANNGFTSCYTYYPAARKSSWFIPSPRSVSRPLHLIFILCFCPLELLTTVSCIYGPQFQPFDLFSSSSIAMTTPYNPQVAHESTRSVSKESQDTQDTVAHNPPSQTSAGSNDTAVYSSYTFKTADLKKIVSNISGRKSFHLAEIDAS
jgi:hypothetical protein